MTVKKQLFEQLAKMAQAISSPQRLELLDYLAQAERSVEELSELAELSVANTSQHLQVLKQKSLVEVRKKGNQRFYYLASDQVIKLISTLRETAESQLTEVNQLIESYLTKKDELSPISHEQLIELSESGRVVILDVRPEKEFLQGHILNAINVPPETLSQQIDQLEMMNHQTPIVTYCRGPYCLFAHEAAEILRKKGFKAQRLMDGFPEWKAAGLPVQSTAQTK